MAGKVRKKYTALVLTLFMILSILSPLTAWAEEGQEQVTPQEALSKLVDYYKANQPSTPTGDWEAFVGLWGAGKIYRLRCGPITPGKQIIRNLKLLLEINIYIISLVCWRGKKSGKGL